MNTSPKSTEAADKNERSHLSFFWFLLTAMLVIVDQLTKVLAFNYFTAAEQKSFFAFQLFKNYNFAFSIPLPSSIMFVIYFLLLGGASFYAARTWNEIGGLSRFAWVLVLAGGLSNVGERLLTGYVKDFIKINTGFFNFADVCILAGIGILIISSFSSRDSKK